MQLGVTQEKLRALGVETLAVVNTPIERARLYFKHRPARVALAADPDAGTHRSFGLPRLELTPDVMRQIGALRINPTGELPEALSPFEAMAALNRKDSFEPTAADQQIADRSAVLVGHFLVGRDGIVRWAHVEARENPAALSEFPSDEEIIAAADALPR